MNGITDFETWRATAGPLLIERAKMLTLSSTNASYLEARIRRERGKLRGGGRIDVRVTEAIVTEIEYAILQQLAADSPQLVKIADLAAALESGRTAVGKGLRRLELKKLVCRPHGERSGFGITEHGKSVLKSRDSSIKTTRL